ncbi:MAG: serine hydrolase, partial [Flavobacteriales bacterium]
FQAASISKPAFTMAVLKLAEQGALDIDADVNTLLKSWKLPENEYTSTEKVTLERLLGHVAGTTVHGFQGYAPGDPLPTLVNILNGQPPANSPPIVVDQIPGSAWRYSGGGYCVASQVLLDVMGGTIPEHMDALVLKPLGMTHSTFQQPLPQAWTEQAASGYLPDRSAVKSKWHVYPELSPDGLWTTPTDLARLMIDLQKAVATDSGKVLRKASAARMMEPFVEPYAAVGLTIEKKGSARYFDHGGWNEGFCGMFVGHTELGKGAVVMINANDMDILGEVVRSIARAYDWPEFVPQYKEQPLDARTLGTLTGRYRIGSDDLVMVTSREGKLFRQPLQEEAQELVHIGGNVFVSRMDDRFRKFVQDSTGAMTIRVMDVLDATSYGTLRRMKDDEHIPFEAIERGDRDAAVRAYSALNPTDPAVNEEWLNNLGYQLMNEGKVKQGQDVFFVNMQLYPKSANVYDSYAEACLKLGDKSEALRNYKRAMAMNPQNANAARIVAELEREGVVSP